MKAPGAVTANGRSSNDNSSCEFVHLKRDLSIFLCKLIFGLYVIDVFNKNKIILAPNAASGTAGAYFLGRPWRGRHEQDSNSTHELTP